MTDGLLMNMDNSDDNAAQDFNADSENDKNTSARHEVQLDLDQFDPLGDNEIHNYDKKVSLLISIY